MYQCNAIRTYDYDDTGVELVRMERDPFLGNWLKGSVHDMMSLTHERCLLTALY